MNFGKNIKKIRSIKKLSQSAFAEIFGITRSSIGAYEEGRAEPKLEIIIKIAKHFSISVDSLINSEITVNELSHFHLLDEYLNTNASNSNLASSLELLHIALVGSADIQKLTIEEAAKNAKNKICLPGLDVGSVSILVDGTLYKELPKSIKNKDIIIVNPASDVSSIELKNKYCLIKKGAELLILEVEQIKNDRYLLYSSNVIPEIINIKEVDFILPIEMHVSNAPMVRDDASDKIKKLELMVNDLYNRLE